MVRFNRLKELRPEQGVLIAWAIALVLAIMAFGLALIK